jgi:protein SCO1/2
MGSTFRQLAERLPADNVTLLSISFDTAHDTPEALEEYARWHQADGSHWRLARIDDRAELEAVLDAFSVVVIPDGYGGFQHNAAVHIINRDGRLARVLDYDERIEDLADAVRHSL